MSELEGRRALVTGGARGLGRAIAELLVARGAQVMLADIDEAAAKSTAAEIGDAARAVRADTTKAADVQGAIDATVAEFGGLDTLINNAGIEIASPLAEQSEEDFDRLMDINVKGVWLGMKLATPALAESGRGVIVNLSSVAGLGGVPLLGSYCASKAAVLQLTRTYAAEMRDATGIRCNAVCPSFVATEMVERLVAPFEAALPMSFDDAVKLKQGRLGTAEEVAETVAFLVSDDASFTTGTHFVLDNALSVSLL
jgi:NAD(P)-dependent dehydrogenase (short-subunit alcohol dehydrogenase family)